MIASRFLPGSDLPSLRLFLYGEEKAFTVLPDTFHDMSYALEQNRGYECCGDLWTPGYFRLTLHPGPRDAGGLNGVVGDDRRAQSRGAAGCGVQPPHASRSSRRR